MGREGGDQGAVALNESCGSQQWPGLGDKASIGRANTEATVSTAPHDTEPNATPAGAVVAIASGVTAGETALSILADPDVIALIGDPLDLPAFLDRRVRARG